MFSISHYFLLVAEQSVGRGKADVNGNTRTNSTKVVRGLVDNFARLGSISIYPGVSRAVTMGVTLFQVCMASALNKRHTVSSVTAVQLR